MARGLIWAVALAVVWTSATAAWASFPGRNGRIVYEWTSANKYVGSPTSIRTVDPRTGRLRVLRDCPLRTDPPTGYPDCQASAPRYSPEGASIALPSVGFAYPPGEAWQSRPGLTVLSSAGSLLTEHVGAYSYQRLAWSPAGDRFLLQRATGPGGLSGESAIFLASLDGTELSQVTSEGTQAPDWSSTGHIAFSRFRNPCPPRCSDVYVTRFGGTPRRLTYRGGYGPSWSPHGTKLAFVRGDGRQQDIYLVRRDGGGLRRLTHQGGHSPAWSPDGKWIAFIRQGDVYVVRTDGRHRRHLVDEVGPDEVDGLGPQVVSVDWQPLPRR